MFNVALRAFCRVGSTAQQGEDCSGGNLLDQGWSWHAVAEATGVQKDTLRRRLAEAELVAQKSPGGDGG